ncbi:serine/threonine-protein kinase Nek4-like [Saccostrea cucullata]|uniref:serine/threonine-protein kinase Nek4-like n=1 Tax=Saccostrea cuccullata TaxID=36930 RepID=UPI002ED12041
MGVCVYVMATLEQPFHGGNIQLAFKFVHGQLPMPKDRYSPQLINLMERMLCRETDKRPSAEDLLNDVLFKTHVIPKVG